MPSWIRKVSALCFCTFCIGLLSVPAIAKQASFQAARPRTQRPIERETLISRRQKSDLLDTLLYFTAEGPSWNDQVTGTPWDTVDFTIAWGDTLWHQDEIHACAGESAMWCGDPDVGPGGGYLDDRWQALITPPIALLADHDSVYLVYSHWLRCEECHYFFPDFSWDGYNVRIDLASDDTTFFEIKPYHVEPKSSFYDTENFSKDTNEWRWLQCWDRHGETDPPSSVMGGFSQDTSTACSRKVFDLRPYAGETVQIAFVFASDWAINTLDDGTWFGLVLDDILIAEGLDSLTIATLPAELGGDTLFFEDFKEDIPDWEVNTRYPVGNYWWLASGGHTGSYKTMCSDRPTDNIPPVCENAIVSPKIAHDHISRGSGMWINWYLKGDAGDDNYDDVCAYNKYKLDDGDWENISVLTKPDGISYVFGLDGLTDDSWYNTDQWSDYMTDLSPLVTGGWDTLQVCVGFCSEGADTANTVGLQVDDITVVVIPWGGIICGKVSGPFGPIGGARVVAVGELLSSGSDIANPNGYYLIASLIDGSYDVTASADGYQEYTEEDVEVSWEGNTDVDFFLSAHLMDLSWSTFLGGSEGDYSYDIAVNSVGQAYVAGYTYSSDFPTTPGAYDVSINGYYTDVFAAKFNAAGNALEYATYLGGNEYDWGWAIALGTSGQLYLTGYTGSADFPSTPGSFDESYNGNLDAFVVRLSSGGNSLEYGTFLGGSDSDFGTGIAVNDAGDIFVGGYTFSADFPVTPEAFEDTYSGSTDAWVVRIDASGSTLDYATYLGGSNSDYAQRLAVDDLGNAYVTGATYSSDFPFTPGVFDNTYDGLGDVFIVKLNSAGSDLEYGTYLGGSQKDIAGNIVLDDDGGVFIGGYTESEDFPVTTDAYDSEFGSSSYPEMFVAQLNPAASYLKYSTYLGGEGVDDYTRIARGSSGNIYLVGTTSSTNLPVTVGAWDGAYNGSQDVYVARFNLAKNHLDHATYLGSSNQDYGQGISLDGEGNVYVTGTTSSADFPTTAGAFDENFNGECDGFVSKISFGLEEIYECDLGVSAVQLPSNVANDVPLTIDEVAVTNYGRRGGSAGTYAVLMTITKGSGEVVFGPGTQVADFLEEPNIDPFETELVPLDDDICQFTFTEAGEYIFYIWTYFPLDEDPFNDTLRVEVQAGTKDTAAYAYPTVYNNPAGQGELRYHDQGFYNPGGADLRAMSSGEIAAVRFTPDQSFYPFFGKKALVLMKEEGQSCGLMVYDSGEDQPGSLLGSVPFTAASIGSTAWQEIDLSCVSGLQDRSADFWLGVAFPSGSGGDSVMAYEGGDPEVGGNWGHSYLYSTVPGSKGMEWFSYGNDWLMGCLLGFGSVQVETVMVSMSGPPKNAGGNLYLGWPDVSQAVRYYVYRTTTPEPDTGLIYDSTDVSHYVDMDAVGSPTTHYYYWFHAVHQDGKIYDGLSHVVGEFDRTLSSGGK